jgi:c-type cytochrome biogenesis protein CcmF
LPPNPFKRVGFVPPDGQGLNPLLQNYWMVIHPVMLYLGYVGVAVPFAFAVGALLSKRLDNEWVRTVRRWTLVPWMFLSLGIIMGSQWAYMELGWGGYWAWDPVENASFLPWLTATAFLHSIIIQEQRGILKVWNVILIWATYFLVILGTFTTRSGVLESVHSFARSGCRPLFPGLHDHHHFWLPVAAVRPHAPAAQRADHRLLRQPRSRLHVQQLALCRHRLRHALGHLLPHVQRNHHRPAHQRRRTFLQQSQRPALPGAHSADGCRPAAGLASH